MYENLFQSSIDKLSKDNTYTLVHNTIKFKRKKNERLWEIGQQFLDITYTWILHIDDLLWIGRTTNEQTADHKVHTGRCFTNRLVLTQMIHMHQKMANKQEMFK